MYQKQYRYTNTEHAVFFLLAAAPFDGCYHLTWNRHQLQLHYTHNTLRCMLHLLVLVSETGPFSF